MSDFPFHYTPENCSVSGNPKWISPPTDGDTPTVQLPIRMASMDAPERHYGGADDKHPGKFDDDFEHFLNKAGKDLDEELRDYLRPRLRNRCCSRQIQAGIDAFHHFQQTVDARLARKGKNGKELTPRHLFVRVSNETFDRYGRMLAYINAAYETTELASIPADQRPSFNLQMMQDGYGVSLVIYPNIPKPADLELVQTAVREARQQKKGLWKDGDSVLLPYEFRWIVDTIGGKRHGPDRYCADIASGELYVPQQYFKVLPENRLFFYEQDLDKALEMKLTPTAQMESQLAVTH